ncbi:hypothetical protein BD413DRAFT_617749 [Trametes elegans]|nr:hypothetical protein BD413DRAFT_618167 [Trametes elegans]KAI0759452.1 hypothetical protein BD413DRAFT_617749 [Trametes elegans]
MLALTFRVPISPSLLWSASSSSMASSATRSAAYLASSALFAGCVTFSPAAGPSWAPSAFVKGLPVQGQGPSASAPPKASKKPLVIFLLAIFGVPYAMHKLLRVLAERQQQQQQAQLAGGAGAGWGLLPPLDPSQLTFARALYTFDASSPAELALKEN